MTDWHTPKVEPMTVEDTGELLRYKVVKKELGVKDNSTIRRLVNEGKLIRVRMGPRMWQLRITRASLDTYLHEVREIKATQAQFGITAGQWGERARLAKAERDKALFGKEDKPEESAGTPCDPKKIVAISDLGNFASTVDKYMDPISRRLVPNGCYLDETESIICGTIAPCYMERIMQVRMHRRGMNINKSRMIAQNISTAVDEQHVQIGLKKLGDAERAARAAQGRKNDDEQ